MYRMFFILLHLLRQIKSQHSHLECRDFTRMNNHLTGDGDFMITHAQITREQCEVACLNLPPQRYCQAYALTHGNNCSLTGYALFPNDSNIHYRRICRKGRGCFKQMEGWEAKYTTGYIAVPEIILESAFVMADFCRKQCESLVYCVSFDVQTSRNFCPFTEVRPQQNDYYSLYLRVCKQKYK